MIERQTIDGREATIAYFDRDGEPVDKTTPDHYAKILFDDGEMLILRARPDAQEVAPEPDEAADPDEGEAEAAAWDRHRARYAPRRIKIFGQSLATWAKTIVDDETQRVFSAISIGLTSGLDNTDIAHSVIGSRRNNGIEGVTEITRQHILRLARGYLRRRKSRMGGG